MTRTPRRTTTASLGGVAALVLAGCASYTEIPGGVAVSDPEDVAVAFVDAIAAGDAQAACEQVSLEDLEGTADECVTFMESAFAGGAGAEVDSWTVADVTGDERTSDVAFTDGAGQDVGALRLVLVDGQWKVSSL